MKSEILNFKDTLKHEAEKIGIKLDDKMLNRFEIYKNLLIEYNEKVNLTAITDEYEIIMKHFIDSLECVKYIKQSDKVIDVGTGAGFPGVVIAIYFDGKICMTLLDALNKRLIFLHELIEKMQIDNIEIVHGRAEEMAHKELYRNRFDIAISRAVAQLNILLEYDITYVKIGGRCLFLKGDNVKEEINLSNNALNILKSSIANIYEYKYLVEEEEYSRNIVEIKRIALCNDSYPRNYGKIKKDPL